MRANFHLKTLTVAIASLSLTTIASAAGLDRSGQDVTAFLQDGTYAETVYTYIDADVTGKDISGNKIDDIAEYYDFFRYGVKTDINDTFSIGILYDEPFGAAADYVGDNNFVAQGDLDSSTSYLTNGVYDSFDALNTDFNNARNTAMQQGANATRFAQQAGEAQEAGNLVEAARLQALAQESGARAQELAATAQRLGAPLSAVQTEFNTQGEATNVEVRTESVTGILGAKFGNNKEFQVYGGPVVQRVKADVALRGNAYSLANGYTTHISSDTDVGWLAGISYSKPEIALKAALTYRSEIDHENDLSETYPLVGALGGNPTQVGKIDITTPESVNFDFQTGINPTTLATARVRWVPWSDFSIVPPLYNEISKRSTQDDKGLSLVSYDDDQWVVELGLAKRLAPALAISGNIGWDSGAGDPVTSLGPIEGYYSVGLGAKYNFTDNWAVSAGGKYLWFGDAEGQIPTQQIVSEFEDNDGYIFGVKLSYQAKQDFN